MSMNLTRKRILFGLAIVILLTAAACVRTLPGGETGGGEGLSTDEVVETKDAQVQMTLQALLGTATAQSLVQSAVTEEPSNTPIPSATPEAAQLTALSASQTAAEFTATATITPTAGPTGSLTPTPAPCYVHRFVYDESYPDGTRVDPGESFQKVWRLQNVGACEWSTGEYQLVFVSGSRMGGTTPLKINYSVAPNGYANFAINLTAPAVPGTYRGYWVLETTNGEVIGWGPDADQAFWVEIIVRGASPTP